MSLPSVSIIMSITNRQGNLRRSLMAWSLLDYPEFDFTIIDNGTHVAKLEEIVSGFKDKLHIQFYVEDKLTAVNILYNKYGKASKGDYIVFSMMDEIISHGDVLQKMIGLSDDRRATLATSFLNADQTSLLESKTDWQAKPSSLPTTWVGSVAPQAAILGHITGNYRKNWEWFGWYRDLPHGHLWLEQDVHIRELCLNKLAVSPTDVWCYHQFHPAPVDASLMRPGFHYKTELEARLIEKAERDRA